MILTRGALSNGAFTAVVTTLLVALGLVSFFGMPRSEDPVFELPNVIVVASYPGAEPETLETQVIEPLEDAIRELDDVRTLESTVQDGLGVMSVEFEYGIDANEALDDVLQKINREEPGLPEGLRSLEADRVRLTDVAVLQVALFDEGADAFRLVGITDELERAVEAVPGVQELQVWGLPDPEVRVEVDPNRLEAHGVPIEAVLGALSGAGLELPGGDLDLGTRRFNVRTSGDFESLEQIRTTVVLAGPAGPVRIRDLATVRRAFEDETHRIRVDGEPAVIVTVRQREGTNLVDVAERARTVLEARAAAFPDGVRMETIFDQTVSVRSRVGGFIGSLLQGMVLVGVVMLIALGPRAAFLVVLTIPVAILLALAAVDVTGFGLQQMSIVGLIIALGLLVDDAIVVVENITVKRREGASFADAALRGTEEVSWPSVAGTVTTVLAFLPMVQMPTGTGDYIRSLPVTVIYALLASLFLSLTILPLVQLALRGRRADDDAEAAHQPRFFERGMMRAAAGPYTRTLRWGLRRPARVLAAATAVFLGAFALFPLVGVSLFPKAEKPQLLVNITAPEGTSLAETSRVVSTVDSIVRADPQVVRTAANAGHDHPMVYYNVIPRRERSSIGQVFVEAESYEAQLALISRLEPRFARVPGARITITEFENGPPVEAPVVFKVTGPDLDTLAVLAARIEEVLRETPGARGVENPLAVRRAQLDVRLHREKAWALGLDPERVDRTVRASLAGVPISNWRGPDGEDHDVVVRLPFEGDKPGPEALGRIRLAANGGLIPLSQIAALELTGGLPRIDHYDGERVATVTSNVRGETNALEVTRLVSERLEAEVWPEGYRWFAGGTFEEQQEGFGALLIALNISIFGIFGVLVLQFRSLVQPLVIFGAVPLSLIGAIGGLFLTGYTFSFTAFIGITSLVGIVINNSILLVEYANRSRREGVARDEALLRAGRARFAPIVLTTLTTIGGLLPLALSGSDLWSPLAVVIIGGLTTSTVLTLLVVPVLYQTLTREAVVAGG